MMSEEDWWQADWHSEDACKEGAAPDATAAAAAP